MAPVNVLICIFVELNFHQDTQGSSLPFSEFFTS